MNRWWMLFLIVSALGTPAMAGTIFSCGGSGSAWTATSGQPCYTTTSGNLGNFQLRNGNGTPVDGTRINMIPTGYSHNGYGFWYQTQQNIQAFSTTFSWIPNGQNFAFTIQNTSNNTNYQGTSFASGAGCEGGFYQAYIAGPPNENIPNNLFALEFDQSSLLNTGDASYTNSSVQIYMSGQSPCSPNDSGPGFWPTTKFSTSPVAMNSPANNKGVTTGDTYSATVTYDGSNLVLTMYDATLGSSCSAPNCFTQTWSNVRMPSLVGATTALIGFTGGVGPDTTSQQSITQWSYTVNTSTASPGTGTPVAGGTNAANPIFSPGAGTYSGAQSVTLSSATTSGAYFCYALGAAGLVLTPLPDNFGGCAVGTLYSGAVPVSASQTLYAVTGISNPNPSLNTYEGNTGQYSTNLPSGLAQAAYTISGSTPQATTPSASPGAGTYSITQNVALTTPAGGTICWSTSGTPATNGASGCSSGTLYTGAIAVSSSETLSFVAGGTGYTDSAVGSAAYTITLPVVATPTFSPGAGTYSSAQSVTVADSTSGATIYYTTNGSTPTTASAVYSGAITVNSTETLQAIATASGYTQSAVGSAAYTITSPAATPTFSPGAGTYSSAQSATIADSTSGATIYYTTNGTTPTTASAVYSGAIAVSATETLQAIATASGYTQSAVGSAAYTINLPVVATPTFSPGAGTYSSAQSVTVADSTSGATIYYTTNGTTPTTTSPVYSGAIAVSATETLQAIATASGYTQSAVGSANYTITSAVATPTFAPVAGTYSSTQSVVISDSTSGATIYYTTNGTTPTTASAVYSGAIAVSATETLQAIATASGYTQSSVGSAGYTIAPVAATPTFSPGAGTFSSAQSVTLSDSTSGATIYYTTNGTTPTPSSVLYTGAILVSSTQTLQAIAIASGYTQSAVGSAAYTINPVASQSALGIGGRTMLSGKVVVR